jgi:hypothetical protein
MDWTRGEVGAGALIVPPPVTVTPANAGVHHRNCKFERPVMDSRFRGNDENFGIG